MTTNNFDPEISNANLNSPQYYIDDDGSLKFISPYLASSNFDGIISVVEGPITAQNIKAGMLLQVISGQYYPVVSVAYDDPDLETSANIITVGYLDSLNELSTIDYNFTDSVNVRYEDWDNKVMGSQGWTITSGGNAIFTNVAVRGRIEADEGYISGNLTIGSGGTDTINDLATTTDLAGYIPDGQAAADIISNNTTITGGNIFTGTIKSQFYSYTSGLYSDNGTAIGLDGNGYMRGRNFYIDTSGNAYFRGNITGSTITGSTLTSAISGQRVDILSDRLNFYGPSNGLMGTLRGFDIGGFGAQFIMEATDNVSQLFIYANSGIILTNSRSSNQVTLLNGILSGNGSGLTNLTGANVVGNISGKASNISSYTIDQNLGTGNNVTFNTIKTNSVGSSIKPATFDNAQTQLQIRASDNVIGIQGSTLSIKTNIIPLIGNQLHFVNKEKDGGSTSNLSFNPDCIFDITPVEYIVISDENKTKQIGFIVEDLLEHWPQAVTYDDKNPISYNTNSIVAGLIYAIKKQKNIIDDLENRMLQLEAKVGE